MIRLKLQNPAFLLCLIFLTACGQPEPSPSLPDEDVIAALYNFDSPKRIPDRYIVVMKPGLTVQNTLPSLRVPEDAIHRRYTAPGFQGFALTLTNAQVSQLRKNSNVAYIEADTIVSATQETAASWGLDRIDQRSRQRDGIYNNFGRTGEGVNAYVIDSGIRGTHNDFYGRSYWLFDFDRSNPIPGGDCNGHGTHVAGTLGGTQYGVAKRVKLYSVRVLDCQAKGTNSNVLAGVNAVTTYGKLPAVVNMSIGGSNSPALADAIRTSIRKGFVYVVAAGNDAKDACSVTPANVAEAITVANSDSQDKRSSDSNFGNCIDIFAPGAAITSASHRSDSGSTIMWGTSMAAPHVAGVVALHGATSNAWNVIQGCASKSVITDARSVNNHLLYSSCPSDQSVTITSDAPNEVFIGATYTISAVASSGLPVVFSTNNSGICTVSGNTVQFVGLGFCYIYANQPGNALYKPASRDSEGVRVIAPVNDRSRSERSEAIAKHSSGVYLVGNTNANLYATVQGEWDGFLRKYSSDGSLTWGRQFSSSSTGSDGSWDLATDPQNNAYVLSTSIQGASSQTPFLRKFTPTGQVAWTKAIWGTAITNSGSDIIVVGANEDAGIAPFVRKYSSSGSLIWSKQFGTSRLDLVEDVAVDTNGGVYVVGSTYGALTGSNTTGTDGVFIRKYSSSGSVAWTRQNNYGIYDGYWGNTLNVRVATGGTQVYLVANLNYDAFSSEPDIRVIKYSPAGANLWESADTASPPVGTDNLNGVSADGGGNLVFAGDKPIDQDDLNLRAGFVRKMDSTGRLLWNETIGVTPDDRTTAIVAANSNDYYAAGDTAGALGNGYGGQFDAYVRRLSAASGASVWTQQ